MQLVDIFRRYGPGYVEQFGERMPLGHLEALADILSCRTNSLGGHLDRCDQCGYTNFFYHSCYNRVCPICQGRHANQWLEKREEQRLPVKYFHLVFTLPKEIHPFVRSNPVELLDILFKSAVYSLNKLLGDPKYGGGKPGLLCVLQTWTQKLEYHPHIHCLMPAVLIVKKENGDGWEYKEIRGKYLVPVHALAEIFRAKFVKMARKKLGNIQFPKAIWQKPWVVFCKPTIKGAANVIKYLSRYLYRVAITNSRIVAVQDGKVTFKYRNNENFKWKTLTLDAMEFIRRFLQHVLPMGFHKIRYYGFLAPSSHHIFLSLKYLLLQKFPGNQLQKPDFFSSKQEWRICPICKKGNMVPILSVFSRKPYLYIARPPPC